MLLFLQGLVAALVVVRLLIPTETSVQGGTLWVVQLWLLAGAGWSLFAWRSGDARFRLSRFDVLLWLIVIGHAIGTVVVFTGGGDRRATINMVWEWVSLGVTFYLVRRVFYIPQIKKHLILAVTTTAVVLAGQGIWQHFVVYPDSIKEYEKICSENSGGKLQQKLSELGVPLDRSGRMNWENRLRSTEPRATFALANSFAGLLASLFVLLLIWGSRQWRENRVVAVVLMLALGIMGYCLILSKCRTAWAGILTGLCLWGMIHWGVKTVQSKKWMIRIGIAGCLLVAVFGAVGLSGGIDREVFTEAPKSLLYRFQWWHATADVIKEHPILGVGAGNFRSHYLQYKLPESSEEISDPHNLFLDIWTSGGILAFAGLMGMLFWAGVALFESHSPNEETLQQEIHVTNRDPVLIGTTCGFLTMIMLHGLLDIYFDQTLIAMLIGWLVVYLVLRKLLAKSVFAPLTLLCAGVVLVVHMLGAGGIERPAIVQTLLILLAVAIPLKVKDSAEERSLKNNASPHPRSLVPAISVWVVLFLCCLMTATLPVLKSEMANNMATTAKNRQEKENYLRAAAEADPFATSSLFELAQLSMSKWLRPIKNETDFEDAIGWLKIILDKEPRSSGIWHVQGRWYLLKYEESQSPLDIESAVNSLSQSVRLYPTSLFFRKDLAFALSQANKIAKAHVEAKEALRLDKINRKQGHSDKYLSQSEVKQLQIILKTNKQKQN